MEEIGPVNERTAAMVRVEGDGGEGEDPRLEADRLVQALIRHQNPLPVVSRLAMYLSVNLLLKYFSPTAASSQRGQWTVAAGETAWRLLGLQRTSNTLMVSDIEERSKALAAVPLRLLYRFVDANLDRTPPSETDGIDLGGTPMQAIGRIQDMIFEYTRLVLSEYRLSRLDANDAAARSSETLDICRYTALGSLNGNSSPPSASQQLLLYMYRSLRQQGLRKRGKDCYEELLVSMPDGRKLGTRFWAKKDSIRDFMTKTITRERAHDQWFLMTGGHGDMTGQKIVESLETMVDHEFPEVTPSRYLISTRNGIYHVWSQTYIPWEDLALGTESIVKAVWEKGLAAIVRNGTAPPGSREEDMQRRLTSFLVEDVRRLKADLENCTACNFIDQVIDPGWFTGASSDLEIYNRVQVPAFEHVLRYQRLGRRQPAGRRGSDEEEREDDEEENRVIFWIYALIGRLLYDLKSRDNWDIMPYFKGYGGTGKSSIIIAIQCFYQAEDIGIVSNNIEVPFGLKAICNTLFWAAPEIGKTFRLPRQILLSMISRDRVAVPRKFMDPLFIDWISPGIACGNELPGYLDASGSFTRRIALVQFETVVGRDGDPDLARRMRTETVALMVKANAAARHAMSTMGHKDIWTMLPNYFQKTRMGMQEQTNTLIAFIRSGDVMEIQDTTASEGDVVMRDQGAATVYSVTKATFEREYVDWCKKTSRVPINMSDQHQVTAALSVEGIRIVREERLTSGGNRVTAEFIYGIRKRDVSIMDFDGGGNGGAIPF